MMHKLYQDRFTFLKNNKKIVLLTFIIFFVLFFSKLLFLIAFQSKLDTYSLTITNGTSEEVIQTESYKEFVDIMSTSQIKQMRYLLLNKDPIVLFFEIFLNNILVAAISILFGITGIIPLYLFFKTILVTNQLLFSSFLEGKFYLLYAYLHAFIELPTAVLSFTLGFIIFFSIFKRGSIKTNILNIYKEAFLIYLLIILPLLFIAAIIEVLMIKFVWLRI